VNIGPIFDEVAWYEANKEFRQQLVMHGKAIGKAAEAASHAMVDLGGKLTTFGENLTKNTKWWGVEGLSLDELAREEARRKRKAAQAKCLRGRVPMLINYAISLACPQCGQDSVIFSGQEIWCLACSWTRPRRYPLPKPEPVSLGPFSVETFMEHVKQLRDQTR
jgi:hypothetical protein